jgi:hypothetical protein
MAWLIYAKSQDVHYIESAVSKGLGKVAKEV